MSSENGLVYNNICTLYHLPEYTLKNCRIVK